MDSIKVRAPATTANMGAGFDVCGMALEEPFDEFVFSKSEEWKVTNSGKYPAATDPEKSVFAFVWKAMRKEFNLPGSLRVDAVKGIKIRAGMGASAAEGAATAFAVNELFGLGLPRERLVFWAGCGEAFTSGEPHYDNVSPCISGGFTVTYSLKPLRVRRLDPPAGLHCLLVLSDIDKTSTGFARSVLPEVVERRKALRNSFYLARLLTGFFDGDLDVVLSSFEDEIVEPSRARAGGLPNFANFKKLGRQFGFGTAASGAGPTLIAFGRSEDEGFSKAVANSFGERGIRAELVWTRPSLEGVREV